MISELKKGSMNMRITKKNVARNNTNNNAIDSLNDTSKQNEYLTPEEELELFVQIKGTDREAADRAKSELINSILPYLRHESKKAFYSNGGGDTRVEADDYIYFFRESQADEISATVCLMILAVGVFVGEDIRGLISFNLAGYMLGLFLEYSLFRGLIGKRR